MISSIILQIIRLWFNIYVSNKITSESLGVFNLIMATYIFGITLASSGINISCIRVVSEELALKNNNGVIQSSKKCIKISILISVIASFIFYLLSNIISKYVFQQKVGPSIIYLICIALPLISVSSAISGYFTAVRRAYKNVICQFLEQISKVIITIILFNYFSNITLENACLLLILSDVLSEFICFFCSTILYIIDINYHFSKTKIMPKENLIYKICRILFPVALISYIKSALSTIKQLLIPSSLQKSGKNSADSFSEYGIISGMAMPIVMFPSTFLISVANLLIPEFSRYYIKNDYRKIKTYIDKLLIGSFFFSILLSFIFYHYANKLGITIYHNNKVGIYIKLFSLLIPFMYTDIIIDNILKGLDAQTNVVIINVIDLFVTLIFIFLFVPLLGLTGYIISIFISEILNFILSLRKLLKLQKNW